MIDLVPMTESEFSAYTARSVRSYADAHIKAGDAHPDEALALAQADYDELLPAGLASPNQHLFTFVHASLGPIGIVWFQFKQGKRGPSAYIYDFEIREDLRGRGLGRQALQVVLDRLAELGATRVSLNVFGYNLAARSLYEKLGFGITGIGMTRSLAPRTA